MKTILLFSTSYQLLQTPSLDEKIEGVAKLYEACLAGTLAFDTDFAISPATEAGLPAQVKLVAPKFLPRRRVCSVEGRAALIHAILHIEYNAINLALDAVYRFRQMPMTYYENWLKVAREEAYHFKLLAQHLSSLGYQYGDFVAHNGLWEMAQKTAYDVLARMALVPRLLEARGLDVTPDLAIRLLQAGDKVSAEILSIIFHDEIGHVKVGNHWYAYLCQERGLDPLTTFVDLLQKHAPTFLRGPFAVAARRKAGFQAAELELFDKITQ